MIENPINVSEVKVLKKDSAKYWKSHIEKCQSSGLSKASYCRKNNLVYTAFLYWNNRLLKGSVCSEGLKLVELKKSVNGNRILFPPQSSIRVWFGEICIEVGDGFSSEIFSQLVEALHLV